MTELVAKVGTAWEPQLNPDRFLHFAKEAPAKYYIHYIIVGKPFYS